VLPQERPAELREVKMALAQANSVEFLVQTWARSSRKVEY
jgi:hypothetical protein